jgi:hypothetical protein
MAIVTGMGLALLPAKLLTEAGLVTISYQTQRHVVFGGPAQWVGETPPSGPTPPDSLVTSGAAHL